jgi:transposase
VAQQLDHLASLDARIEQVSAEVAERTRPCADAIARLDAIPGVGQRTAEVLVAEVGTEMGRFPTPGHLASWAGMCPGNHQSAGQRKSGKTRKGSPWLRGALAEAAQAAARTKGSYLQAQYRRLAARRGKQRAIIAVGHTILRMVYHLLRHPDSVYEELGARYFDERDRQAIERRLVRRLERLGYQVALEPIGAT